MWHASQVKEHMDVISSDRKRVGKVDDLDGPDKIKLTKRVRPTVRIIISFRSRGSTTSISTST
jgi:hypothetical protein